MRDFERRGGRLRTLPFPARLVYTIFLAFTLAALALTVWLTEDMVRLDLSELGPYYAGTGDPAASDIPPDPEAPLIELPPELEAPPPAAAMSRRKLLEVTHFHLFSMPVYLLILSHLYMLSRARAAAKITWIAVGTIGVTAHIAAPWAAAASGSSSAWLFAASGVFLAASFTWMSLVPLWEMWARAPE
jgi:hypothetical protein